MADDNFEDERPVEVLQDAEKGESTGAAPLEDSDKQQPRKVTSAKRPMTAFTLWIRK